MDNAKLNDVLITLSRSLLQYIGEAWPWAPSTEDDVTEQLKALVKQQQSQIARLAALLTQRENSFDMGTYPTDYTDLQYLSLSYLLARLIRDQEAVLRDVRAAARDSENDATAHDLLEQLQVGVSQTLESLKELSAKDAEKKKAAAKA